MSARRTTSSVVSFFVVAVAIGWFAPTPILGSQPSGDRNYIGIEPLLPTDADGSNAFADLSIHAQMWMNDDGSDTVALDADGWPLADASTVVFGKGNRPGAYHLRFEGRAESIELMWLSGRVDSLRWDSGSNTTDAVVTMDAPMDEPGGLILHGTRRTRTSAVGTGFRNLHLWRPGYPADGSRLFTDEWEALMSRFDLIRFMDWASTNRNPIMVWSDRRRPGTGNPGEKTIGERSGDVGIPVEYMVALCNRTGSDAWINVPVLADSAYVTNLVRVALHGSDGRNPYSSDQIAPVWQPLKPGLKLYLEFGNELWNQMAGNDAFAWLHDQSESMRGSTASQPIFFDNQDDEWTTHSRWIGWRAAQMSLWARKAATDAAMMTRIRPVLGGQLGDPSSTVEILSFLETWFGAQRPGRSGTWRVKDLFWGSGGAIYSGSDGHGIATWFDPPNYPNDGFANAIAQDAVLAGAYGLARVAYGGGPSLDSIPEDSIPDYLSDARMKDAMRSHQEIWTANGGDLAVYCCAGGDPARSFIRGWGDTSAPKLQAIESLRRDLAKVAVLGCTAPCEMRVGSLAYGFQAGDFWNMEVAGEHAIWGIDSGEWLGVPVVVPSKGNWTVALRGQSADGGRIQVLLADSLVAALDVPASDSFQNLSPVSMELTAGLAVVRIRGQAGECAVSGLKWMESGVGVKSTGAKGGRKVRLAMARGSAELELPGDATSLQIMSLDGSVVSRVELAAAIQIDLRRIRPGILVARVQGGTEAWSRTIVVP